MRLANSFPDTIVRRFAQLFPDTIARRFAQLFPDTIARRFAATVIASIVVAVTLTLGMVELGGAYARPPLQDTGILDRADDVVRMMEVAPGPARAAMAATASNTTYGVAWVPASDAVAPVLKAAADKQQPLDLHQFHSRGGPRRMAHFRPSDAPAGLPRPQNHGMEGADARIFGVELHDQSWVVFSVPSRFWGLDFPIQIGIRLAILTLSIALVSGLATNHLARPIKRFTAAVARFGVDPRSSPVPVTGPRELRAAIEAFNAMQAQIQRFVDDRTAMLAAISHDLRTPLTRMRLRAELIEDGHLRQRQCRDVEDMQAMIDSALSFFRDEMSDEETTVFDLPELLRTIADDYSDQGIDVPYRGPDRADYRGRPFALKRALTNLVDNAVKYAESAEIELCRHDRSLRVSVRDRGPGIPDDVAEQVFAPFFRLERSRNRATGGVGLGLTSARAVVRGHGGDIVLHNRSSGGLEVEVSLPTA